MAFSELIKKFEKNVTSLFVTGSVRRTAVCVDIVVVRDAVGSIYPHGVIVAHFAAFGVASPPPHSGVKNDVVVADVDVHRAEFFYR